MAAFCLSIRAGRQLRQALVLTPSQGGSNLSLMYKYCNYIYIYIYIIESKSLSPKHRTCSRSRGPNEVRPLHHLPARKECTEAFIFPGLLRLSGLRLRSLATLCLQCKIQTRYWPMGRCTLRQTMQHEMQKVVMPMETIDFCLYT